MIYLNIKIIGANCKNGMQLYKMATRAIEEVNSEIQLEKLDDKKLFRDIMCKTFQD